MKYECIPPYGHHPNQMTAKRNPDKDTSTEAAWDVKCYFCNIDGTMYECMTKKSMHHALYGICPCHQCQ